MKANKINRHFVRYLSQNNLNTGSLKIQRKHKHLTSPMSGFRGHREMERETLLRTWRGHNSTYRTISSGFTLWSKTLDCGKQVCLHGNKGKHTRAVASLSEKTRCALICRFPALYRRPQSMWSGTENDIQAIRSGRQQTKSPLFENEITSMENPRAPAHCQDDRRWTAWPHSRSTQPNWSSSSIGNQKLALPTVGNTIWCLRSLTENT